MITLGDEREFTPLFVDEAVQPQTIFSDQFVGDLADGDVAGEFDQSVHVQVVVLGGADGSASLYFDVLDEVHDQVGEVIFIIFNVFVMGH